MLTRSQLLWPAVILGGLLVAGSAFGANGDGQADLDKATETKLTASSVSDLDEVIRLAEIALKKGLDATNTEFANRLLGSTLFQRAQETAKHLFTNLASADDLQQRRKHAIADVERSLKLEPKQAQAYLLLAQLNTLPGGGTLKDVIGMLDKAIDYGSDDPPTKAKALVLRASLQEMPDKKRADFDEAVQLMPDDAAAVRARGLALADMDKPELALADLNKAIELDPTNGPTHEAKAIVLARMKKYEEAIAAIDKAAELSPKSVGPLVQKARIHVQQRKFDAAVEDMTQALKIDPNNVALLLLRAGVYQEQRELKKAMADMDEALKLKPDAPLVVRTRALFLAQTDRIGEAIAELERLKKLDPKDTLTLLQLALFHGANKDSVKAIETYTALLALTPNDWRALRGRGDALLNVGRHAEAIADYEKAIKLEPKDDGILNNLAWVLATSPDEKLRNGRRAIELATEACKATDYKVAHIVSTLAAAYAETGDFDAAIKWSTKASELANQENAKEGDTETKEALKKELENYKAKKPTRERLSEAKVELKKLDEKKAEAPKGIEEKTNEPKADEKKSDEKK